MLLLYFIYYLFAVLTTNDKATKYNINNNIEFLNTYWIIAFDKLNLNSAYTEKWDS